MPTLSLDRLASLGGAGTVKYVNAFAPLTRQERRDLTGAVVAVGMLGDPHGEDVSVLPGSEEHTARTTLGDAYRRARIVAVGDVAGGWRIVKAPHPSLLTAA